MIRLTNEGLYDPLTYPIGSVDLLPWRRDTDPVCVEGYSDQSFIDMVCQCKRYLNYNGMVCCINQTELNLFLEDIVRCPEKYGVNDGSVFEIVDANDTGDKYIIFLTGSKILLSLPEHLSNLTPRYSNEGYYKILYKIPPSMLTTDCVIDMNSCVVDTDSRFLCGVPPKESSGHSEKRDKSQLNIATPDEMEQFVCFGA